MLLLDETRIQAVTAEAQKGFMDCRKIIDIHNRDTANAVLNPYIVLAAVATWERYIVNLLGAAERNDWDIRTHDEFSSPAPWPGCRKDEKQAAKHDGQHNIDHRLIAAKVLTEPITTAWCAWVSTDYRGAYPRVWRWGSFAPKAEAEERAHLRQGLLGAKSARDAVAHRIYHQKASEAESTSDISKWHFTWSSDTYLKTGTPTIQNGYARGVVALLMQLMECTNHAIGQRQGFDLDSIRLDHTWFEDYDRWSFRQLHTPMQS